MMINTMGVEIQGHTTVPYLAFPLQGEKVRPAVGLVGCSSESNDVKITVYIREQRSEEKSAVGDRPRRDLSVDRQTELLFRTADATQAADVVRKIHEGEARKNLRKQVQVTKQIQSLKTAFNDVDADGSGEMDHEELGVLLKTLGQEFTEAELRDKVRQLDDDNSGTIGFDEFVALMTQWQEDELHDMFSFFDADGGGDLGRTELTACLQAIGQDLTPEEVSTLASQVDSDGSGEVDVDEFIVFMRPFMSITKRFQYSLEQDGRAVVMLITSVGVQIKTGGTTTSLGFNRITECFMQGANTLVFEVTDAGGVEAQKFESAVSGICDDIVGIIGQQFAKKELRRKVQLNKQRQQLRVAFGIVDASGDGLLDLDELRLLLQTLGQELTDAGLRDKVRHLHDAAGTEITETIDFEQFADLMTQWQRKFTSNLPALVLRASFLTDCLCLQRKN